MSDLIFFPVLLGLMVFGGYFAFRALRRGVSARRLVGEYIFILVYLLTFVVFLAVAMGAEWNEAVDELDGGYTAYAHRHILSAIVWLVLFLASALLILYRGRRMPPLLLVLCMTVLIVGIVVSAASIIQLAGGTDPDADTMGRGNDHGEGYVFVGALYPVMNIVVALLMLGRVAVQEAAQAAKRRYKNPVLDSLNRWMAHRQALWVIALLAPVYAVVTAVLLIFGQEPDSMAKVLTETSTWSFSQMTHPPYLGHEGHYLCTVAACGHPKVVRPVRLGRRHGREIIVNRQLMVANAWEEWLAGRAPRLHRFIRRTYDRRGYPLSRHITSPWRSDAVYVLMKPWEWFFTATLYLATTDPEARIRRQYK